MKLIDLVKANRSYRRFDETVPIPEKLLQTLVDMGRICPSAANRQSLKYRITSGAGDCSRVFPCLKWAAYLPDWEGPAEGERPTGYVTVLNDSQIVKDAALDAGITSQTMLLGAAEQGYGGCMLASVQREALREIMNIPEHLDIVLVIALGKPVETVILEETGLEGSIKYYRDSENRHHVPKRPLKEVLLD